MRERKVPPGPFLSRNSSSSVQAMRHVGKTARHRDARRRDRKRVPVGTGKRLASITQHRATPFARAAFAVWGMMTEIVGATLVVAVVAVTALAVAATSLAL
jgi:hypothetical protein